MTGYSIFNHGQAGHVETPKPVIPEVKTPPVTPEVKIKPVVQSMNRKVRSPRGWAVEAGLGLGPQFKD